MEIQFTEFTIPDKEEVLQMMRAFNALDGYQFDHEITGENLLQFRRDKSLGKLFLIKNREDTIGYIVLTFGFSFEYKGRDAFIDELYIKDEYRSQGIGKRALEFIEKEAIKSGVKATHLEVEAYKENANQLYLQQGFVGNDRKLLTKKLFSLSSNETY